MAFVPARMAWLERGGILAIVHVRGGGERVGVAHGGAKLTKPNTEDFTAAEYLIRKYTCRGFSPAKAAARVNLIGRAVTERPTCSATVRRRRPDAIRMETTINA